jgi:hypothetical protein
MFRVVSDGEWHFLDTFDTRKAYYMCQTADGAGIQACLTSGAIVMRI